MKHKSILISVFIALTVTKLYSQESEIKITLNELLTGIRDQDKKWYTKSDESKASSPLIILSCKDYQTNFYDGLEFNLKNNSSKTIDAFKIISYTTDTWGVPQVQFYKDENNFPINPYYIFDSQDENIPPKTTKSIRISANFSSGRNAKKTEYRVLKIHFTDQSLWSNEN